MAGTNGQTYSTHDVGPVTLGEVAKRAFERSLHEGLPIGDAWENAASAVSSTVRLEVSPPPYAELMMPPDPVSGNPPSPSITLAPHEGKRWRVRGTGETWTADEEDAAS